MRLFEIQADPTTTPEFRRWFRDSKVVDQHGRPLRVHHGTITDIAVFEPRRSIAMAEIGFWFAADAEVAWMVAMRKGGNPSIMPVYLSIQNPLVIDQPGVDGLTGLIREVAGAGEVTRETVRAYRDALERRDHDGIILRNVRADGGQTDNFIAFRPEQIKSVFNRGSWDTGSPHISEGWDATHRVTGFHRTKPTDVDVHRNPSLNEFKQLLPEHGRGLRGLLLAGGDLVVWDAWAATHGDLEGHYKSAGAYLLLKPDGLKFNDINYYYNEGDCDGDFRYRSILPRLVQAAHSNASLRRIYGDGFAIVGFDNETGEDIDLTPEWLARNCCPLG